MREADAEEGGRVVAGFFSPSPCRHGVGESLEANRGITLKWVAKANGSIVIKVSDPDAEDAAAA